ncbi:hypothetical protein V6N13_090314 [Hibiscus sabdariffa]
MEMASDNNITITVQDPPPPSAPAPSESTSYSPLEDQAEISQPRDIDQERNPENVDPLPKARDHLKQIEALISNKHCIYRVPHLLREVNERAYDPNVISIGPYHHGKPRLKRMEAIKLCCFLDMFKENISDAITVVKTMGRLEEQVRVCYDEPSDHLNSQQFVDMMVYDGCFIVYLIMGGAHNLEEDIFKARGTLSDIVYDLLLLENQLPFFVLVELCHIIMPRDLHQFAHKALSLFRENLSLSHLFHVPNKDIKHLLDLVHSCYRPSAQGIKEHGAFREKAAKEPASQCSLNFIGSATELDDAGIGFFGDTIEKMMEDSKQGIKTEFDIMFTKDSKILKIHSKVLKIPTLKVEDSTERTLRNYIAYEQFIHGEPTYFSDYVKFMDNLINTSKDVQLLRKSGIIDNWLGDDEAVAQMFNRLQDSVWISNDFYYAEIFLSVNEHCQKRWKRWKAALKKNYFNSPWLFISFLAATVLLLLTIAQTIFSVLSHFNKQN